VGFQRVKRVIALVRLISISCHCPIS
jgi:hypothetical protein